MLRLSHTSALFHTCTCLGILKYFICIYENSSLKGMTYEIWKYSVQAQKQTRFPANENTHELDYGIFLNLFNVPNDPSAAYDVFTHTHTKETD